MKQKEQKFIQLGLKRKGRIVKNEQYTIREFIRNLKQCTYEQDYNSYKKLPSLLDRLRPKKILQIFINIFESGRMAGYVEAYSEMERVMNDLIDADEFGKKGGK